ncbi:furin-like [Plakobranchus ocellatus]|uniref:Furin-like n=1 Tax=Plakobranchus ocellatus TaxID=259542 RepID=A0AAV4BZC4_9GAST|nr:furin-like [Plakobranchus ocellatus]
MGTSAHHMRRNGSSARGGHGSHGDHRVNDDARAGIRGPGPSHGPTFTCAGVTSNGICIGFKGVFPYERTECKPGFFKMDEKCVDLCPQHYFGSVQAVQLATPIKPNSTKPLLHTQGVCKPCHESCLTCKSSEAQDCFQCANGFERKGDLCEKKMIWDMLDPDVMKHLAWAIIICIAAILLFSVIFGLLQARERGRLCWQTKPNYVPDWSKGHYDGVTPPGWRGSKCLPLPDPPSYTTTTADTVIGWRKDCLDTALTTAHSSSLRSGSLHTANDSGVSSTRSSGGGSSSPPPSTISSPGSRNSPGWRHITGKSAPLPPLPIPSSLPLLSPPSPPPLPPTDLLDWGGFTNRRGEMAHGEGMIPPPPSWRDQHPQMDSEPPPLPPRPSRPVEAFWEAAGPGTGTHFLSAAGSSIARPDDICPNMEDDDANCVQEAGMILDPGSNWLKERPFTGARHSSSNRKDDRRHCHHRHHHKDPHSNHHHQRRHYSAGLMPAYSPTRIHHEDHDSECDDEVRRLYHHHHPHEGMLSLDRSIDTDTERVDPKFAAHTPPPPTPPPAKISPSQRQHQNQRHQLQNLYPAHKHHKYKGTPSPNSSSPSSSGAQDV